jgi:uncharacterized membrane protein (DUF4010 family)
MPIFDSTDLPPAAEHWPFVVVLSRLAMAVGLGVFIGLEREHNQKTGVRTFALVALLACVGGLMGDLFAGFALGFVALVVIGMNYRQMRKTQRLALTTSVALTLTAFAGILFGKGHMFTPTVAGIVTAALLAWKQPISRLAVGVSDQELRSAILLAILTFVIFPVLPADPVDPWGLIEPKSNWASVIIIAGIGFINYVLMRLLGARGMELTAFFGGLVNSRKVIVELGLRGQALGEALLPTVRRGVVLATGAMLIRNSLIVAVLAPAALARCALPFGAMLLASMGLWRRIPAGGEVPPTTPLDLESPFKLSAALKFGLVFLVLNVAGALAQRELGSASFYLVSVLGGLLSSASSIAAAATLMARGEIDLATGINGILLASLTSVLANLPLVRNLVPSRETKRRICIELLVVAGVGLVSFAANGFVFDFFARTG